MATSGRCSQSTQALAASCTWEAAKGMLLRLRCASDQHLIGASACSPTRNDAIETSIVTQHAGTRMQKQQWRLATIRVMHPAGNMNIS